MDYITLNEQLFVKYYVVLRNAAAAYRRAYDYTGKNAGKIGYQLLQKPKIQEAIEAEMNRLNEKCDGELELILQEYRKIAFSDIKDFLEFKTVKVPVDVDAKGKMVYRYEQVIELKPSSKVDGSLISEISMSKDGTFKFKLHDKEGALNSLSKIKGVFVDKQDIDLNVKEMPEIIIKRSD